MAHQLHHDARSSTRSRQIRSVGDAQRVQIHAPALGILKWDTSAEQVLTKRRNAWHETAQDERERRSVGRLEGTKRGRQFIMHRQHRSLAILRHTGPHTNAGRARHKLHVRPAQARQFSPTQPGESRRQINDATMRRSNRQQSPQLVTSERTPELLRPSARVDSLHMLQRIFPRKALNHEPPQERHEGGEQIVQRFCLESRLTTPRAEAGRGNVRKVMPATPDEHLAQGLAIFVDCRSGATFDRQLTQKRSQKRRKGL